MTDVATALTKLSEAYDLAPGLFGGAITAVLAIIGGAFWFGRQLESSEKKTLVEKNSFLTVQFESLTKQYNSAKEQSEQTSRDLAALKAQIEELKARDPRVGGQLDASIERAQASNNSVTDIVVTAAEYIAKLLG